MEEQPKELGREVITIPRCPRCGDEFRFKYREEIGGADDMYISKCGFSFSKWQLNAVGIKALPEFLYDAMKGLKGKTGEDR